MARQAFAEVFPGVRLALLYDVSHNTCKEETHSVDGRECRLFVHRKGVTRAFGPGHAELPCEYAKIGQPVLIGGSMGTAAWILAGCVGTEQRAFGSACHGAGRAISPHEAMRRWQGRAVVDACDQAGLAGKVARLSPLVCVKG